MKYLFIVLVIAVSCSSEDTEPSPACVEITQTIKETTRAINNFQGSDRHALEDLRKLRDSLIVQQQKLCN